LKNKGFIKQIQPAYLVTQLLTDTSFFYFKGIKSQFL